MGSIPLRDHLPSPSKAGRGPNPVELHTDLAAKLLITDGAVPESDRAHCSAVDDNLADDTDDRTVLTASDVPPRANHLLDHRRTVEPCTAAVAVDTGFLVPHRHEPVHLHRFSHSSPAPLTYFYRVGSVSTTSAASTVSRILHCRDCSTNTSNTSNTSILTDTVQHHQHSLGMLEALRVPPSQPAHPPTSAGPALRRRKRLVCQWALLTHPLLIDDHPLKSRPVDTGLHFPAPGTHRPPQRTRRDTEVPTKRSDRLMLTCNSSRIGWMVLARTRQLRRFQRPHTPRTPALHVEPGRWDAICVEHTTQTALFRARSISVRPRTSHHKPHYRYAPGRIPGRYQLATRARADSPGAALPPHLPTRSHRPATTATSRELRNVFWSGDDTRRPHEAGQTDQRKARLTPNRLSKGCNQVRSTVPYRPTPTLDKADGQSSPSSRPAPIMWGL